MIKKLIFTLLSLMLMSTGTVMSQGDQPNGSGSSGDPYKIATKDNLHWLSQNSSTEWDAVYEQTEDIAFDVTDFETDGDFYNNGNGFFPIGNSSTNFTGSYDGQGNTIDGLFIDRSNSTLNGLFGYIGDGGEVTNLGVTNIDLTGQNQMGGLAGKNNGLVENSFTTGVVDGGERTGGLVGHNDGTGKIENSYSGTEVIAGSQGNQEKIGGLVGDNSNASIKKSYSFGVVDQAGVGSAVGGLTGREDGGDAINENSFWDTQTSGQSSSGAGSGKTTNEMKNVATFTDETNTTGLTSAWDFVDNPNNDSAIEDIWNIAGSINNGYPYLDKVVSYELQFTLNSPADGSTGVSTPPELDVTVTSSSGNTINVEFYQVSGWDIGTASYDEIEIDTQDTGPEGIHFSADGVTMYVMGYSDEEVYQFSLTTPWDLSTAVFQYSQANVNANSSDLFVSPDGENYYELEKADGEIHWMDMDGGEISTVNIQNINATISTQSSDPEDIYFSPDGTMLYELSNSDIYEYELSTAWDISTAIYSNVSISTQDASSTGLFFHPDGDKIYELGDGSNQLHRFSLSTAWDLSTATPDNVSIDLDHGDAHSLFFKPTGTQLYYVGRDAERAYSYSLSSTGELIASVPNVDSGTDATHTWEGLDELTYYEWYATDDDGSINATSDTWSFRTWSPIKWSGETDSQWNIASNWLEDNPPINSDDVLILGTAPNMPIVSNDVEVNNLEIQSNADLTINPDKTLKVNRNITNNGQITFKSDVTGDSYFDEFTGNISGTGDIVSEKYYPARRAFRLLSPSLTTSTSIRENWQEDAAAWDNDPHPGFGTHITGIGEENPVPGTNDGFNGFDWQPSGNPSLFEFDNSQGAWVPVTNTNSTNLVAGNPYRLMLRGSRAIDVSINDSPPSNTILRENGVLSIGEITYSDTGFSNEEEHFILIGNPYQSIVDLASVYQNPSTSHIKTFVTAWDPTLGGTPVVGEPGGRGAFVVVDLLNNTTNTDSEINKFLQPKQAVFFYADGTGTPSIVFNEEDKATSQNPNQVFNGDTDFKLNLLLYDESSFNQNSTSRDAFLIRFKEHRNNAIDTNDAPKPNNLDENLARLHGSTLLAIEERNLPIHGENLGLFISQYQNTNYVFKAIIENLPANTEAYLVDHYLNETHVLSDGITTVNFSIDPSINASTAYNRFSLSFGLDNLSDIVFNKKELQVYPNPSEGVLNIQSSTNFERVSVYSLDGKLILQENKISSANYTIDLGMLESGVYIIEVEDEIQQITNAKVIIK
ncbi:T9SS type A sorting domain-containing protein [Psychroflexus planctonicus]|nr:T9SS type A sorting domain-containing protein [Psychroflexus planctonicus]